MQSCTGNGEKRDAEQGRKAKAKKMQSEDPFSRGYSDSPMAVHRAMQRK
jgi:hypothetical protein